jgi:hypothetical protein
MTCNYYTGDGSYTESRTAPPIEISHVGDEVHMLVDGTRRFSGTVVEDAGKPELRTQAVLLSCACNGEPGSDETVMVRLFAKAKPGTSDIKLKGQSIVHGEDPAQGPFVGSCKYKYTAVSIEDPAVVSCRDWLAQCPPDPE